MPKPGIKVIEETPGTGAELKKGDRVKICYACRLNRGESLANDQDSVFVMGDREIIAGLRYGLEGMRVGGKRRFSASPHLCYRDKAGAHIPANAVLIFDIKKVEILEFAR